MRSSGLTPERIALGLRQADEGTPLSWHCRKMGLTNQAFCCLMLNLEEWRRLKKLVADPDTCLVEDYHE